MPYPPNDIKTSGLPPCRGGNPIAWRTSSGSRRDCRAINGMSRLIGSRPRIRRHWQPQHRRGFRYVARISSPEIGRRLFRIPFVDPVPGEIADRDRGTPAAAAAANASGGMSPTTAARPLPPETRPPSTARLGSASGTPSPLARLPLLSMFRLSSCTMPAVACQLDELDRPRRAAFEQPPRRRCLDDDRGIGPATNERPNHLDGPRCVAEAVARDVKDNRI